MTIHTQVEKSLARETNVNCCVSVKNECGLKWVWFKISTPSKNPALGPIVLQARVFLHVPFS